MPSGVEVWVVPTRLFGETELTEAADARIATIPGGSSLKVSEPHFAVCHRGLEEQYRIILMISRDISASFDLCRRSNILCHRRHGNFSFSDARLD